MINIPEIERFDNLIKKIYEVMEDVLTKSVKPTDEMIKNLVEIELGYINTNHPDFVGGIGLLNNSELLSGEDIKADRNKKEKPKELAKDAKD